MVDEHKITIKEFRMWLQGVEEMQDPAWVPNPVQWQRIREKINTIEDDTPPPVPMQPQPQQIISYPVPSYHEVPVAVAGPSSLGNVMPSPAAPPPSGLFATPEAPNMPVRTPNIDTTNGTYQSSFA